MMFDALINHSFVHAPSEIDEEIVSFCAALNPSTMPVFLTPQPHQGSIPGECYSNVERAITSGFAGTAVSGWLIWTWPGVFIEAEHHMVIDDGVSLVDVTPPPDPADAVLLFLPDPTTPFDTVTRKIIRNRNRITGYAPLSRDYLDAGARLKAMNGDVFGELHPVDSFEYTSAQFATVQAKDALLKKMRSSLGRNDPCLCGSGKKFKRCHDAL